jgi:hypothetical protein
MGVFGGKIFSQRSIFTVCLFIGYKSIPVGNIESPKTETVSAGILGKKTSRLVGGQIHQHSYKYSSRKL